MITEAICLCEKWKIIVEIVGIETIITELVKYLLRIDHANPKE